MVVLALLPMDSMFTESVYKQAVASC